MSEKLKRQFNKRGETLVEMLVSILIGALATLVLATTIANSVSINKSVDAYDLQLREDIAAAESRDTVAATGTIKIGSSNAVNVNYYGNERMMSFQPQ